MGYIRSIPTPFDAVANIAITLYGNGEMAISGNIGDARLAMQMLDHARDAVKNQLARKDSMLIPNRDVDVKPNLPLTIYGDSEKQYHKELVRQTIGGVKQ